MNLTRRDVLEFTIASASFAMLGGSSVFAETPDERARRTQEKLAEFLAGSTPTQGRVSLKVAELQENGFSVPISVSVESPMTPDDYVSEVLILSEANPDPGVLHLNFTPMSGTASLTTRIRLARTQNILAVAKMNDGSTFIDKKFVKVTIGGCGA